MAYEKTVPQWDAAGTEPPVSLKTSGFTAGYKPPAAYFNWFFNSASGCLSELQTKLAAEETARANADSDLQTAIGKKADSGHTHNYAGSSSAGGAATSANKLNTNDGSATNPVYFANGVPVKTTYTLGASVPSGAKFTDTDTNYYHTPSNTSGIKIATGTGVADMYVPTGTSSTTVAVGNHTHNYAGSSSAGGAATSANKLNTDKGDSNTPVYFSGGVPVACTGLDLNTTGSAAKWTTARKITLSGDVSGSVSIDGSGDVSMTTTVADDSHNHVISNVDGLQSALDAKFPTAGGALTGSLTVIDNFNVNKTYDSVEYKTYVRPVNYELGGEYTTGLIHYIGGTNNSQLLFNKSGVAFRDNVAGKLYQLFGQHNAATAATSIRSNLYTYGTSDLTAGSSSLETGKLYFVYEE